MRRMSLRGRVAVITGASSGIGLACAEAFAGEGMPVVLTARRADRLDEAVKNLRTGGGRAESVVADVTSETGMDLAVQRAQQAFGRLDVMVCNAGFGYYGTVEDTPPDVMRRMMDVNFMGTYLGARAALPIFRRQGHGHLIIVSSIVGRRGIALMSGYSATKAAVECLIRSLSKELAGRGVRVNGVAPGPVDTDGRPPGRRA